MILLFRAQLKKNLHFSFPLFSHTSLHKRWNSLQMGTCALNPNNKRKYSGFLNSSRPRTKSFTTTSEICNLRTVRSPKILSSENYPILQSNSLQHWFKNWQELRKHKLTGKHFWWGCWFLASPESAALIYGKNNPEDDWLAASPDGVVDKPVYGLPSQGVLEIKCPFFNGDMSKASPWSRIPLYYIPQAQGLMEILDRNWMDFYVWTPKGSSLFRFHSRADAVNLNCGAKAQV
ncbi:hypothetical protein F0562_008209 [Nyssa sinensis]|uniref:YqaJ viral recombinase domain-containing protein n=1 Tax=Nyssa sinensis TaxID=561372 RepID=A0A5J5A984_9ASTE|nr:hypothetical protein F0562_008209 [Nyssa sinensis]